MYVTDCPHSSYIQCEACCCIYFTSTSVSVSVCVGMCKTTFECVCFLECVSV